MSLKKQSYYFRNVKPDVKGRNWLTLSYSARERPSSRELLRGGEGLFRTPSNRISHRIHIVRNLTINFVSDLGFSALWLKYFTDPVAGNLCTQ